MTAPTDGTPSAPPPGDDLEALLADIDDARHWTWVLDFDGVLAPIVDHPDDAVPGPGAWDAVAELAEVCEVAVLSGRPLDDLAARFGTVPPDVLLIGGHGSEAGTPDGQRVALTDLDAATASLDEVEADVRALLGDTPGWLVERKVTSLAVHHRRVSASDQARHLDDLQALLDGACERPPGFVRLEGKAVVELKAAGVDKGRALAWIDEVSADRATRLPDAPPIRPLVLGDDVTDEDAFVAANAVGGEGVLISEVPLATAARFRLRDPSRVVTLLRAARSGLGARPTPGPASRWEGTWGDRP